MGLWFALLCGLCGNGQAMAGQESHLHGIQRESVSFRIIYEIYCLWWWWWWMVFGVGCAKIYKGATRERADDGWCFQNWGYAFFFSSLLVLPTNSCCRFRCRPFHIKKPKGSIFVFTNIRPVRWENKFAIRNCEKMVVLSFKEYIQNYPTKGEETNDSNYVLKICLFHNWFCHIGLEI